MIKAILGTFEHKLQFAISIKVLKKEPPKNVNKFTQEVKD